MNFKNNYAYILGLICCFMLPLKAMKQNILETDQLLTTTDSERELVTFTDDERFTKNSQRRALYSGAKSHDNELFVLPDGDEELPMLDFEEPSAGYLNARLAKLKNASYDKIAEASEFVDSKFVAGIATATALSALVWLVTSSLKKEDTLLSRDKSSRSDALAKDTISLIKPNQSSNVEIIPENEEQDKEAVALGIAHKEQREAEISVLKEQLLAMKRSLDIEKSEKAELLEAVEALKTRVEDKEGLIGIMLESHPNPEEFIQLLDAGRK